MSTESVFDISVALAQRRTEAKRQRCGRDFASGRRRGKTGSSARVLTMTAAADVIRDCAQSCRQPGARCVTGESPPPSIGPLPSRFLPLSRVAARPVAPPQPHRRSVPATPSSLRRRYAPGENALASAWRQTTPRRRAMLRRVDEYRHESRGRARWACPSGLPVANRRA